MITKDGKKENLFRRKAESIYDARRLQLVTAAGVMPEFPVNKIAFLRGEIKPYFSFADYLLPAFFRM